MAGWDFGANYATWFALKYPHLVSGVWASNTRTFQTLEQNQTPQLVESVLRDFSSEACFNRIENGFRQLEEFMATNQTRIIERTFRLCFPLPYLDGDLDIWMFFDLIGIAIYLDTAFLDKTLFEDLICGSLLNAPVEEDFEALAYLMGFLGVPPALCVPLSFERHFGRSLRDSDPDSLLAVERLVFHHLCFEGNHMFNSGDGTTIFGSNFPVELGVEACRAVFG